MWTEEKKAIFNDKLRTLIVKDACEQITQIIKNVEKQLDHDNLESAVELLERVKDIACDSCDRLNHIFQEGFKKCIR